VLGSGSWGTALAIVLAANGHSVRLWDRNIHLVETLRTTHENSRYLPGHQLPPAILPTSDMRQAIEAASAIVIAVPSGAVRRVLADALPAIPPDALLISAAKGLDEETSLRPSQTIAEIVPNALDRTVVLSGPNLAVEVASGLPTAAVAASSSREAALAAQRILGGQPAFRVYTGRDVVGVELGGAVKNSIAIGAGICDGLGYGDNSKAALMTRGLAETMRLGVALGADPTTFLGLSGVGDLIATGASKLSRNHRVGMALGLGTPLEQVLADIGQVAEGVPTTRVIREYSLRHSVEMPLCLALYAVLFEGRSAPDVIRELLLRPARDESALLA
jgi:glycerol-3-phosphate dehydrogenase (NAD(P)+)